MRVAAILNDDKCDNLSTLDQPLRSIAMTDSQTDLQTSTYRFCTAHGWVALHWVVRQLRLLRMLTSYVRNCRAIGKKSCVTVNGRR